MMTIFERGHLFLLKTTAGLGIAGLASACTGDFSVYQPSPAPVVVRALDADRDGLDDRDEALYGTHPGDPDSDADGLSDGDEVHLFYTDPLDHDSDADALGDGDEVELLGTDPLDADTDRDELFDGEELDIYLTDPLDIDTDGDGLGDGHEVALGGDPLSWSR